MRRAATAWIAATLLAALAPAPAASAQWTRPDDDRLTISGLSWHRLDSDAGRPDLVKEEVAVYGEYGFTGDLTLIGRVAVHAIREVGPQRRRTELIDGVETEVFVPLERSFGVGGIELGARYALPRRGPWAIAAQGVFGVPGSGENQINARFGEGGGDTDLRLQAGRALNRGFVSASGGWRNRRGRELDELRLDLTAGRAMGRGVHIFVQSYSVWSVGERAPGAETYHGHRLHASVLVPVARRARLQVGVLGSVYGSGMAREQALTVSLWRRF